LPSGDLADDPASSDGGSSDNDTPPHPHSYVYVQANSYTTPSSDITDADLDEQIIEIRRHFPLAGVTMLHGTLQSRQLYIPRRRIQEALLRIDPVRRVFGRQIIRRRKYSVPGPNSLWHHDGQHGG
jgi:hypothetical protein